MVRREKDLNLLVGRLQYLLDPNKFLKLLDPIWFSISSPYSWIVLTKFRISVPDTYAGRSIHTHIMPQINCLIQPDILLQEVIEPRRRLRTSPQILGLNLFQNTDHNIVA